MPVKELCRKHGFSDAACYGWRSKFAGMQVSEAKCPLKRMKIIMRMICLIKKLLWLLIVLGMGMPLLGASPTDDWATQPGFRVYIDSTGHLYPTSIAFVPQPTEEPEQPYYYVAELHGRIKVVTRNRAVYIYADNLLNFTPGPDGTEADGGIGLVGVCVHPTSGDLFATMVMDDHGVFRNKITRLRSHDGGRTAAEIEDILILSQDEMRGNAHQIQGCIFGPDGKLYASVGNGDQPRLGPELTSLQGKILRLNADGSPPPDNPFFDAENPHSARNYIYATGLRNPFALVWQGNNLIINENGVAVDRLLKIDAGMHVGYDGTDASFRMNATWLWGPGAVVPVGMDQVEDGGFPVSKRGHLFVGLMGSTEEWHQPGRVKVGREIQEIVLDPDGDITEPPQTFAKYVGNQTVSLVALASGPDGLYLGEFPLRQVGAEARILRIVYEPSAASAQTNALAGIQGVEVYENLGCAACHRLDGRGGSQGPDLTDVADNLRERLNSDTYLQSARTMLLTTAGPRNEALQTVLEKSGDERIQYWLAAHIRDPRFDNPKSEMPAFDIDQLELDALVKFLMTKEPPSWLTTRVETMLLVIKRHQKAAALGLAVGMFCLGAIVTFVGFKLWS